MSPSKTGAKRVAAVALVLAVACGGAPDAGGTAAPAARPARAAAPRWERFGAAALDRARAERKLVLLSVQASWCHFCHVMNEETFADPEVLALLEERFVVIRVEADERPDIAERYQRWAWPATAILSPDAEPVVTFRGYRPAAPFARVLREIVDDLDHGRPLARPDQLLAEPTPELADLEELRTLVRDQLDGMYDEPRGGWGTVQKYPFAAPVEHALFRARVLGETDFVPRIARTLEGHATLADPVWGGIYQYSLRGRWDMPHFEKIAAVQAGAIDNFAEAYRLTGDERWLREARRVLDYANRFLSAPDGGFYASQDADAVPHRGGPSIPGAEFYALDDDHRRALGAPRTDTHVYASLNGLFITALVELYEATLDPAVLARAERAAESVLRTHRVGDGLARSPDQQGGLLHLSDQVEMARGLLALHEATGEARYLAEAERTMRFVRRDLRDPRHGGFYAHTEDPSSRGVFAARRKPIAENAIAARVLLRLSRLTGDDALREDALLALRAVADREHIRAEGRKIGEYALALEEASAPYALLSVVGPSDEPRTEALFRAAVGLYHPARLVELGRPGESRYPYPGEPAIYLCSASSCSLPVEQPERLSDRLAAFLGG